MKPKKSDLVIPPYSGWTPRSMRMGRRRHEADRGAKRKRLGNARDRFLYKSAAGYRRDPVRYAALCKVADALHRIVRN